MPYSSDDTPSLQVVFWFAVALSALNVIYAALSARGLVYDGSFYLLAAASRRAFHIVEPARWSVQMLQQLPAVLGTRFGITNLWTLGRLYSLGMAGWPVVLTALCWLALPRNGKGWIAGPLINLVFAIPAASFIGVSEGIIASCLLWLAVLLVSFRLLHPWGAFAALLASTACAVSHESAVLCLVLIGWLAVRQFVTLRGFSRIACAAIVGVSALGVLYMTRWIVAPRSTIERTDFLVSLLGGFLGLPRAPNMPVIASLLAAAFIAIAIVWRREAMVAVAAGAVAVLACAIAFALAPAALASPGRYFAARGLPVALTTVLAALLVWLPDRGWTPARFITRPAMVIVAALVLCQALMQAMVTNLWRGYVGDLRTLVATQHGVISHAQATAALHADGSRFRRELLQTWSVEPLSILLAPDGRVTAFVEAAPSERWVPYRPEEPKTLPHMPQLDWSHFPWPMNH